jgi:amylosucrase
MFFTRLVANASAIHFLYTELYGDHPHADFSKLVETIISGYQQRSTSLKVKDDEKEKAGHWFLGNKIVGMSLYVDRFCGNLSNLENKLDYFKKLGVNFLHIMPIMESPAGESDGGYAVSDFRKVDERFGSMKDLQKLRDNMAKKDMYLMMDIVLNHTSHKHEWALKAKKGDPGYQDFYYMFNDLQSTAAYGKAMPEIFPESSPGNFTWSGECRKWVMTVFHNYQWDLNYKNPVVFINMLDTIFFYANLGLDVLRIDAPAFIWKEPGTTCQNLPKAHSILRLIKQCVQVTAPGMALLAEAIVAPREIMKYFGSGLFTAKECDLAYNATQMALQWDALATKDTKVMLAAQHELLQKPYGSSWITYTRCHDDIGLGYDDYMIQNAGYNPYDHRSYLKNYYSGSYKDSPARGALFSVNPTTQDARISGTLASLCGLEAAMEANDDHAVGMAIRKILLMQAQSFFIGGIPMLFYGDEVGYTNDYSYLQDEGKNYDNRWMHRPVIDWDKNEKINVKGSSEQEIFTGTKRLIEIRQNINALADLKNLTWLASPNIHVAAFLRTLDDDKIYCLFNYSNEPAWFNWSAFKQHGPAPKQLFNYWDSNIYTVGSNEEYFILDPYAFYILKAT